MAGTWFNWKGYLQQRGITFYLYMKPDFLKLCELAHDVQLEIVTSTNDYEQSHVTLYFLNLGFLFRPGNVKNLTTHISHASCHPIYMVEHSTTPLKACAYLCYCERGFIYNITSNVTNQTGSCAACSVRQSTWSVNENTGVLTGIAMIRKHRIGTCFWFVLFTLFVYVCA